MSTASVPRAQVADGSSVVTGRAWNEQLAPALDALRTLGGNGGTVASGVGTSRFDRPRYSRWMPWEIFLDAGSNKLTIHHVGAYVFGPTLDDTGISSTDKTAAALCPGRYGHPWVPKVAGNYIDQRYKALGPVSKPGGGAVLKPGGGMAQRPGVGGSRLAYPTLPAPASTVTYVWVQLDLNARTVPIGQNMGPIDSPPEYRVPITEDLTADGEITDDAGDIVDVSGITDQLKMRAKVWLQTYDIASVVMTTSDGATAPSESLVTKNYLVGWVDRTVSPARKRMFLRGPIFFAPPIIPLWAGSGSTDPTAGLVDSQSPMPPRGEWNDDAGNEGRGAAV